MSEANRLDGVLIQWGDRLFYPANRMVRARPEPRLNALAARQRAAIRQRIEAHIFVAFLAYCLQVTLKANLKTLAGGTTPRQVIAKFKTMQMVDVHLPTTDGRELTLSRYAQPEAEHRILLDQLRLNMPSQLPPKITAAQVVQAAPELAL